MRASASGSSAGFGDALPPGDVDGVGGDSSPPSSIWLSANAPTPSVGMAIPAIFPKFIEFPQVAFVVTAHPRPMHLVIRSSAPLVAEFGGQPAGSHASCCKRVRTRCGTLSDTRRYEETPAQKDGRSGNA